MILDSYDLPDGFDLDAEICIVGAGAVGIAVALSLIDSGQRVLLLEAGGFEPDPETQSLYAGQVDDGGLHPPPDHYRERRFGGSTTIWGGRTMPFDAIDFEPRPYVEHSGWPIGPESLRPFYAHATRLCEAGDHAFTIESAFDGPRRPMIDGFASDHFTTNTLERFSCPTDFGRRYRHKLEAAKDLRVLLHANVVSLIRSESGTAIRCLKVRTLRGTGGLVSAGRIVLALGGLETARLLLASQVGTRYDVVGRYYMCHLAGTIGTLRFSGPAASVWNGYDVADDGTYCRRRLALRPETQRELGIGNFVARLHHPRIPDPRHHNGILSALYLAKPLIPYEYRKRLHGNDAASFGIWVRHVINVVTDLPETLRFMLHFLRYRRLSERKFPSIVIRSKANYFSLDFHAEQVPDPASRVYLIDETDQLGMKRIGIDWRYGAKDVETVSRSLALLAEDIASSGVGRFDYDPASVEYEMTRYGAYGGHHIGTARMGCDPATSVVDTDCRVHEISNLYVAGSAVFPTSSQANPTLTAVALALRLATHLKEGDS